MLTAHFMSPHLTALALLHVAGPPSFVPYPPSWVHGYAAHAVPVVKTPDETQPSSSEEPTELATVRFGGGLGWGSPGAAAAVGHLVVDIGVWRHLALGLEAFTAATYEVDLLDVSDRDSIDAFRARVVGRLFLLRDRLLLSGAVGLGPAWYHSSLGDPCSTSEAAGDPTCALRTFSSRDDVGVGYVLELGFSARIGPVRLGAVARGDAVEDEVGTITLGPTLGFVF